MTGGDGTAAEHFQNLVTETQQTQGVCYGGTGLAHLSGGLFLGHVIVVDQSLISQGFFHRVQILTLQVFNQGQLRGFFVIRFDDDNRNFGQSRNSGGTPPALAGDDLIITAGQLPYRQRLDDAVDSDGICQGLEFFFVKILTGLFRVGFYLVQGNQTVAVLFLGFLRKVTQQCAQAFAQTFIRCQ